MENGRELLLTEAGDAARVPGFWSQGWAVCEAARLGRSQGISLGRGSHCHLCGYVHGSLQVGRSSDHLQPTPPASFVKAAASLKLPAGVAAALPATEHAVCAGLAGLPEQAGFVFPQH